LRPAENTTVPVGAIADPVTVAEYDNVWADTALALTLVVVAGNEGSASITLSRPDEPRYVPTDRQTPVAGQVKGAKSGFELAWASAGRGAGVTVHVPDDRSQNNPFTVPLRSDCPSATHVPADGHDTSRTSMSVAVGTLGGTGAVEAVHDPDPRVSKSPCSTPDALYKPVATQSAASVHATDVSCTSGDVDPPGSEAADAVHVPPDSVASRPS